jgi:hypothetical protein
VGVVKFSRALCAQLSLVHPFTGTSSYATALHFRLNDSSMKWELNAVDKKMTLTIVFMPDEKYS